MTGAFTHHLCPLFPPVRKEQHTKSKNRACQRDDFLLRQPGFPLRRTRGFPSPPCEGFGVSGIFIRLYPSDQTNIYHKLDEQQGRKFPIFQVGKPRPVLGRRSASWGWQVKQCLKKRSSRGQVERIHWERIASAETCGRKGRLGNFYPWSGPTRAFWKSPDGSDPFGLPTTSNTLRFKRDAEG